MKARGVAIQSGLAVAGLLFAYMTWQREPERAKADIVVMELGKNDVQKIRYSDDKKWAELERRKPEGSETDPQVWVKLSARPESKTPERELRGNESARKLFERFTPFRVARSLGVLDAAKLKELGLDVARRKLEITARGETRVFEIGSPNPGLSDPYLRDAKDGNVYVFGSSTAADLDAANVRLIERTLHPFTPTDIDTVTIAAGEGAAAKSRTFSSKPGPTALSVKLTPAKADKPDEHASNWHDKLWRLMGTEILGKGEEPTTGKPVMMGRVDYKLTNKNSAFIEIAHVVLPAPPPPAVAVSTPDGKPVPPPKAPLPEIFVRTESTAGWVKVPQTSNDMVNEIEKLVAE